MRAFACLLVVFHHLTQRLNPDPMVLPRWLQDVHCFGMRGEVGVSIFFVLSGCLLSLPFWKAFLADQPTPRLRMYASSRLARIVPAYYLLLLVSALLGAMLFRFPTNYARVVASMTFVNNFNYKTFFPSDIDTPMWSIGLEVWCYILLPLVLLSILGRIRTLRGAALSLFGFIAFLQALNPWLISVLMTDGHRKGWQYGLVGGAKVWFPYWNLATFFSQFLLGSAAALYICARAHTRSAPRLRADLVGVSALVVAFVLVLIRLNPGNPDEFTRQPYVSPFFAALIALSIAATSQGKWFWRVLDNQVLKYVAKISFGLYLWHWLIISLIQFKWEPNFLYFGMHSVARWAEVSSAVLLASAVIASLSWFIVEQPILNWNRRITAAEDRNSDTQLPS